MPKAIKITKQLAEKVLATVDAGLVSGLGTPQPGKMCVEAAVCYALGLPHGDDPACVATSLRALKIRLNDSNWSSDQARAKGMRKLAVLQLGTAGVLDENEFTRRVVDMTVRKIVPRALLAAANMKANAAHKGKLESAAKKCAEEGTRESAAEARTASNAANAAATAAYAAAYAYAADADARDKSLAFFADAVAQIMIDMKVPAVKWLDLLEAA